ncbi:MAG: hypothetical protein CMM52_01680 [Rhodospirillaceae bacterium]|mgnify:FL=1|nr:hypothetical protein [Rhodospirillaceae bacterium]|tara:strand:+ start:19377 stop:19676 length:300 start_codon:yes stop_codon:yes gene_type:complete
MSSPEDITQPAEAAFEAALKALNEGETENIPPETVQKLLTAGAKLYCRKLTEEDDYFPPFRPEDVVTATEAVVAIAEMMRSADLNTFDLAMWMSRPHSE